MTLKEQVSTGIKVAMKEQDKVRLNALRNINAAFLEFEKEKAGNVVSDDIAFSILSKLEKKRRESIDLYEKGNRPELANQERGELAIIESMLPKKMSNEEMADKISSIIVTHGLSGKKDLGQIMKIMMRDYTGAIDGNAVRKIAETLLG